MKSSTSLFIFSSAVCAVLLAACGSHGKPQPTESPAPTTKPPPLTDNIPQLPQTPGDQKAKPTTKGVWAAFENSLTIRKYESSGAAVAECDVAKFLPEITTGSITALAIVKENSLLALVDPGDAGELLVTIDTTNCAVTPWYGANPRFSKIRSNRIIAFPSSSEFKRIFVAREDGVDRFTYTADGIATRATGPGDAPFVPLVPVGTGNCAAETISGIGQLGEGDTSSLLVLTHGATASRLNVIGSLMGGSSGSPQCLSSFNFAAEGQPTSATDIPVHAVQTGDKRVYVLFANTTNGAKIVRYDFNGTTLSSPFLLSQDQDDVGFTPQAFIAASSGMFLVATGNFLSTVDITSGRLIRRWHDAPWTNRVTALVRE
jgi:hypothetical protein